MDACELFEPLAELATSIAAANGLASIVDTHACRSDEWMRAAPMSNDAKADILVTEILDSELLGEGIIPSIRDAHARLLCTDRPPVVIPAAATVWAQLFECATLRDMHCTDASINIPGCNEPLRLNPQHSRGSDGMPCSGSVAPISVHIDRLGAAYKTLSAPFVAVSLDFHHIPASSVHVKQCTDVDDAGSATIRIIANGTCHGICFWWDLALDATEPANIISTRPFGAGADSAAPDMFTADVRMQRCSNDPLSCAAVSDDAIPRSWRDHWVQSVRFVASAFTVVAGDRVPVASMHDDYAVWFDVGQPLSQGDAPSKSLPLVTSPACAASSSIHSEQPVCTCGVHATCPSWRIWQRSQDTERWQTFVQACSRALSAVEALTQRPYGDASVVSLSDGSIPALIAAACGSELTRVHSIENHSVTNANMAETLIKQNRLGSRVSVLRCAAEDVSLARLGLSSRAFDLVVAEPHFESAELPWHHLYVWYATTALRQRGLLSAACRIMPCRASIRCRLVALPQLSHSFAHVSLVEGIDLALFNRVKPESAFIAAYPLWMYDSRALSDDIDLCAIDLTRDVCDFEASGVFQTKAVQGTAHGVVLWLDWHLDADAVVSGGPLPDHEPSPSRQGIFALAMQSYFVYSGDSINQCAPSSCQPATQDSTFFRARSS